MFRRLRESGEGAFVPFTILGDPDVERGLEVLRALVEGSADALELGIAFSDPLADGPTIQAAAGRALAAGMTPGRSWELISAIRLEAPEIPIGLLVYANLVEARGMDHFYAKAADVGVDSVLVADVPTLEAQPYVDCATRHGIKPVFIATPNATDEHLRNVAQLSSGYTYVVTRSGVTGVDERAQTSHTRLLQKLRDFGAPPCLLGFGISAPEHVRAALDAGAAGAISGSAVVRFIEAHRDEPPRLVSVLRSFVRSMKQATKLQSTPTSAG